MPLEGKTVAITSARSHKADVMAKLVAKYGGEPLYLPVLKIEESGGDVREFAERAIAAKYDAYIFTTGQSAWSLADRLGRIGGYWTILPRAQIRVRGL